MKLSKSFYDEFILIKKLIPILRQKKWKNCYIYVQKTFILHSMVKFTMEIGQNSTIPFLDVLLIRIQQKIHTTVYRKNTSTNLYIHWISFPPNNWKWGTLKTLVSRAYKTCWTDEYLGDQLKHIRGTFNEINNYPHWVISKVFKEIKNKQAYQRNIFLDNKNDGQKKHLLVLPHKGHKGEQNGQLNEKKVKCSFSKEC